MPEHRDDDGEERASESTRRDFLTQVGAGACAAAAFGSGLVTLDYLKPKVLFEPPTTFKVGTPLDYPEGTVRFDKEHRTYVIGAQSGIYALSAVCTHLGCITRYKSEENAIACPCHGSRFDLEGVKIEGPAPRNLPWLEIEADAEGNLVVDTSIEIPHGKVLKA